MNTQFRKGVLEICVLTLISKKDMYGYEIVQNISKVIEVNEGSGAVRHQHVTVLVRSCAS